jgi:hypothetical protein
LFADTLSRSLLSFRCGMPGSRSIVWRFVVPSGYSCQCFHNYRNQPHFCNTTTKRINYMARL